MKNKEKNIIEYIWLFILGCFLGFILETIWYFLKHHVYINKQGLLYGPFKPIYGFGLVLIVLFMSKYKNKSLTFKYLLGVFIGSSFEYFSSLFQEYFFSTSTWDYTSFKYNLGGRICLIYSLVWGIIAILVVDFLYPYFKKILLKIPQNKLKISTIIVTIFMTFNITLSVLATVCYARRINNYESNNKLFQIVDIIYNDSYMQKKFPKLKVIPK